MTATDTIQSELEALRTGAAIFPLSGAGLLPVQARAFLRITGPDATRWLNGMVTNNIKDLAPGEGNYNFLLNAQGRIQGDCTIYREPQEGEATFLLETDRSQLETAHQILDKFIIMDDVELTRLELTGCCLAGGASTRLVFEYLGRDAVTTPAPCATGEMRHAPWKEQFIIYPPTGAFYGSEVRPVEVWSTNPARTDVTEKSLNELYGARKVLSETIEALRILSATPKFDLPQETAQTHALNFNKGCYLGQEIVERIHSRGQVHRTFTAFTLDGALPTLPAPLESNGKPAGELTSAMQIGDTLHALGYLRREFATFPLTYPGGAATPKP
jgi:folate-binding protein YgfZ